MESKGIFMFLENIDLMFAKGRLAVCKKHETYITLIPKNLSSSLIYYILQSDYPEIACHIDVTKPGQIHKYTGLVLVKSINNINYNYKKIAFLRDPFKRILSAFYSKFVFDAAWSGPIINPVANFVEKEVPEINFGDFINFLRSHPDEWLDPHFVTQDKFMLFKTYDSYIPMDNSNELQSKLKSLNLQIPKLNSIGERFIPKITYDYSLLDCSKISVKELWNKVELNSLLPNANDMFTSDLIVTVRERFKDDFCLYEKCFN